MIDCFGGLFADIDSFVSLGADVAVKATLVCLAALVADRLLGRRVLARSALWHACLLSLMLIVPAAAWLPQWRVEWLPGEEVVVPSTVYRAPTPITAERKVTLAAIAPVRASEEPSFAERKATEAARPIDWRRTSMAALAIAYLSGVCLLLVRLMGSWLRATALVRSSAAVDAAGWNDALAEGQSRLGLARRIELRSSAAIGVPLFVGWWRPTVLLPDSVAGSAIPETMRAVLLHELAHARRGDYAWNLLLRLVQAVYWPHPLVWLSGKAIAHVREEACDRVCLYWLGDPAAYRQTLVDLAAGLFQRPAASLGMAIARTTRLERRLARLEQIQALPRCLLNAPARAGLACAIVFAAGGLAALHFERSAEAIGDDGPAKQAASDPAKPTRDASIPVDLGFPIVKDSAAPAKATDAEVADSERSPSEPANKPFKVRVAKVKREDFVVETRQPCSLVAGRTVSLYARVSGIITRRNVELGDHVAKGDVLAEIDAPEVADEVLLAQADADETKAGRLQAEARMDAAKAKVDQARADVAQSEAEIEAAESKVAYRNKVFARISKLAEERKVDMATADETEEQLREAQAAERSAKNLRKTAEAKVGVAAAELEASVAALQVAKLRAEAAQRHLERIRRHTEYLQIRAPIDGAVAEVNANVGYLTTGGGKGERLFVLSTSDKLVAITNLPERDALRVKVGNSATVRFDALPERTIAAKISRMAYAFDTATRTLRAEIDLPNPKGLLRPGMFGIVAIPLETHPQVLTLPQATPRARDASGRFTVYRVVEGRTAEAHIEILSERVDSMEIKGLSEGDIVILDANEARHDGAPVEIKKEGSD